MSVSDPRQSGSTGQARERSIRVFVSSTFRDMAAERDELMKQVFPELRRVCAERDVAWSEVDLRWGITDEQRAEGRVLPVCLAEIQECRPYFIGILGDRYGWIPDDIAPALLEAQPWLAEARGRSVTELEILHGVLNDPAMADHAFFYFRDPAYLATLAPDKAAMLREHARPGEVAALGSSEAERLAAGRRRKLESLKARIRRAHAEGTLRHAPRENYQSPQALGALVRRDLLQVLDNLFPPGSEPDPSAREELAQAACARRHRHLYAGREADCRRLDEHAGSTDAPLAVTGTSGIGKSALLASWADRHRAAHPSDCLIEHYVDASPSSSDWRAAVRRVIGALQQRTAIGAEPPSADGATVTYARESGESIELVIEGPSEDEDLRARFARALSRASERVAVVLLIDGLSQFKEDNDQVLDLAWLPPALPSPVRLIVSLRPGPALDEVHRRQWGVMTVEPLTADERRALVVRHLSQYRKSLGAARVERIANTPQAGTPLYLLTLLDELRLWGEHETLDAAIGRYLEAQTVRDLFIEILQRWEQDYERDRPGLVRESMTALWAARSGLTEREILEALGSIDAPLPQADWAPLRNAAGAALIDRSGIIDFTHDELRSAVEARFLQADADRTAAHRRLADLFSSHPPGARALLQLPWQLSRAGAWSDLVDLLRNIELTVALHRFRPFDLRAYWRGIETNSPFTVTGTYTRMPGAEAERRALLLIVGLLNESLGHLDQAATAFERLARQFREQGDLWNLGKIAAAQALVCQKRGDLDGAMAALREQESACREILDLRGVAASLGCQADILRTHGDADGAMALYREAERQSRNAGDPDGVGVSLGNLARLLAAKGDFQAAMACHIEEAEICRQLGDAAGLAASLNNQGLILYNRGELDAALALFADAEAIARRLGDLDSLQIALGNRALVLHDRGQLDAALALQKEKERIGRQLGRAESLYHTLLSQGAILRDRGLLDAALPLVEEAEAICTRIGHLHGLAECLSHRAAILRRRGRLDEALARYREQEAIDRRLGEVKGIAESLGSQARVLRDLRQLDRAMALLKEEEKLCRQYGFALQLGACLGNQATVLVRRGDLDDAIALERQAEAEYRTQGARAGLVTSLGNQAATLTRKGLHEDARPLAEEAARLAAELGLPDQQRRLQHILDDILFTTGH